MPAKNFSCQFANLHEVQTALCWKQVNVSTFCVLKLHTKKVAMSLCRDIINAVL